MQLTYIQEVVGLNPAGEQVFFQKSILFAHTIFKIQLWYHCPSTHRNRTWAKLNARHLGTQIYWLLIDSCFCLFFTVRWRHWCREKTVNSCGTFLSKPCRQTVVNLWVQSQPKPNFFFQFLELFRALFSVIAIVWAFVLSHAGRYRSHLMQVGNTDAQMSKIHDSFACCKLKSYSKELFHDCRATLFLMSRRLMPPHLTRLDNGGL